MKMKEYRLAASKSGHVTSSMRWDSSEVVGSGLAILSR